MLEEQQREEVGKQGREERRRTRRKERRRRAFLVIPLSRQPLLPQQVSFCEWRPLSAQLCTKCFCGLAQRSLTIALGAGTGIIPWHIGGNSVKELGQVGGSKTKVKDKRRRGSQSTCAACSSPTPSGTESGEVLPSHLALLPPLGPLPQV